MGGVIFKEVTGWNDKFNNVEFLRFSYYDSQNLACLIE